jgi:hypothetical protein
MTILAKRRPLHSAEFNREHRAGKAFHAPQRERPAKVQHPKPVRGS